MKNAKKEKLPAPNAYKIPKRGKIYGPINYEAPQMHWIPSEVWRGKQTPGPSYKIQHGLALTQPRAPAKLYYPRSKEAGGGPGLKGIKNDQLGGPSYYKVNRALTENKTWTQKFDKTPVKTHVDLHIKMKEFIPGVGRYTDIDSGLKLQSRPMSCGARRRIT